MTDLFTFSWGVFSECENVICRQPTKTITAVFFWTSSKLVLFSVGCCYHILHFCSDCISASIELIEKKKQLKLCIQLVCLVNIRHIKLISPWKPRKSKRTTRQTWARATFMKVINRRLARAMPARKCNIYLATKRNFPLGDNYGHG